MRDSWLDVIVCGFYTPGPYAREADRLRGSLRQFGIPFDLHSYQEGEGRSWLEIVRQKPRIIRDRFLSVYPDRPVMVVDVDSVFLRDPREVWPNTWANYLPPMSVHRFRENLLSGTILFSPGKERIRVVDRWAIETDRNPNLRQPQKALHFVPGVDGRLNPEWCWIFDLSVERFGSGRNVIVEHLQASREHRDDKCGNGRLLKNRKERLKEFSL